MRVEAKNAGRVAAIIYTTVSLAAALTFFLLTLLTGHYTWVARGGGAAWVFLLSMIILMPTVSAAKRSQGKAERLTDGTSIQPAIKNIQEGSTMAKDPVCGMQVDEAKAAATSTYKGKTYYFCAAVCKKSFDENPEEYAQKG